MRRLVAIVAAVLLLAGCTSRDGIAGEDGGGYVSGDGTVLIVPAADRSEVPAWGGAEVADPGYASGDGTVTTWVPSGRGTPVDLAGRTYAGEDVDLATWRGDVVVLNFWYAGCPPCRAEAPDLEEVFQEYGDRVTFLGVNVRDSAATASSFEREFGVTYDSILDVSTRDVLSAFAGQVPPSAVPTTLVLDAEGRVAARISGMLPSATTLGDLIDDVLDE
jgi:thiol-disulfide isomerase/thioredoxin